MRTPEWVGHALPPWNLKLRIAGVALLVAVAYGCYSLSHAVRSFFWSLVERRDAIAGSLLPVNASLLGFSITSFSVLLSVRSEKKLQVLSRNYPEARNQLWTSLISASWATSLGAVTALVVVVFKSAAFADRVQSLLAAILFTMEAFVAVTFVGVLAVIQSLVWMLLPADEPAPRQRSVVEPPQSDFTIGVETDDD